MGMEGTGVAPDAGLVAAVLAGDVSYDEVDDVSQAVVRAVWDERLAVPVDLGDLMTGWRAAGARWVVADRLGRTLFRA